MTSWEGGSLKTAITQAQSSAGHGDCAGSDRADMQAGLWHAWQTRYV